MQKIILNLCAISLLLLSPCQAPAVEGPPKILFDQGHGQRFVVADTGDLQLSKFSETLLTTGVEVLQTTAPLTDEALKGFAALVISGPFKPLQPDEIEAVLRFVQNGGRLAVMLHIAPPMGELLIRLGVDFSNSILHERRNAIDRDINFRVSDLSATPLFAGINSFSAYGAWALNPGGSAAGIARTSPDSWVDLNGDGALSKGDAVGAFALVVIGTLGKGDFVIFGDDAIFQNRFMVDENRKLAANLGTWLARR
jgi:hypothetical protein